MDLTQLDKLCACATSGCRGKLAPVHWKRAGLGGAITIGYNCDGCASQQALFETSAKYELGSNTEIGMSVLVAFIIAGCTHTDDQRMAELKRKKSSEFKKRRVERTEDARHHKEWSKKHGHDTYGDDGSDDDAESEETGQTQGASCNWREMQIMLVHFSPMSQPQKVARYQWCL